MKNIRFDPTTMGLGNLGEAGEAININGFEFTLKYVDPSLGLDFTVPTAIVRQDMGWHIGFRHHDGYYQKTVSDRGRTINASLEDAWNVLLDETEYRYPKKTQPAPKRERASRIASLNTGLTGVTIRITHWCGLVYAEVQVSQKILSGIDQSTHRRAIGAVTYARFINDPSGAQKSFNEILAKAGSIRLYSNYRYEQGQIPHKPIHYNKVPKEHRLKRPYQNVDLGNAFNDFFERMGEDFQPITGDDSD